MKRITITKTKNKAGTGWFVYIDGKPAFRIAGLDQFLDRLMLYLTQERD